MKRTYFGALCMMVILGVIVLISYLRSCTPVIVSDPIMSSHGWGTWYGSTLISFMHDSSRVCVPKGWDAVGAIAHRSQWAVFPPGQSAVFVRSGAFDAEILTFNKSSYRLRVLFSRDMHVADREHYMNIITSAFERVGALYPSTLQQDHTVLVTVGTAGDGATFETAVYPEPGPTLSVLVRPYFHARSEELFIHAVAHLYNRHRTDLTKYQVSQIVPPVDFQELEATWIEIYARSSHEARIRRTKELYAVHDAVMNGTFVPGLIFPFSERQYFDAVRYRSVVPGNNPGYSDYQYGHYVLAPLVLVGVEGLLVQRGRPENIADLLTAIHPDGGNMFEILEMTLPASDIRTIKRWIEGAEQIPWDLIERGLSRYVNSHT